MSGYTILDVGDDRGVWLAARRTVVTATDVARLARGGAGVWAAIRAEKAGKDRSVRTWAMQHGVDREPFIASYAQAAFGLTPSKALLIASDRPEFGATPDALNEKEVADFKTSVHDWESINDAPGQYVDQSLWQQRVTGIHRGRLILEPHENGIPLYPFPKDFVVEWDPDRVAHLESIADEFLASTTEPDADAAELDALLSVYVTEKEAADAAAARAERAKADIEAHLGGKPRRFEGSLANLTRSEDGVTQRFDSAGFKKAHPVMYQEWLKSTPRKGALTITMRSSDD